MKRRVLLSWSSGKDAAWALQVLRSDPDMVVVGLFTTFNEAVGRVAMHVVRRVLVEAQAAATRLPQREPLLPWPCSNAIYEQRFAAMIEAAEREGVTHVAFGDLFLEDVRASRVRRLAGTGIEPLFPLWESTPKTAALSRRMLSARLKATPTCVDPSHLPASFAGRSYDLALLEDLPGHVDPCGENGEVPTFCRAGPMFDRELSVRVGEIVPRDGFTFADLTFM